MLNIDEEKRKNERKETMKPKIFVSSTFYDLKYVREELSAFIKGYSFEPILFEAGDIGFSSDKEIDRACYDSMRTADMAILIIGGRYGSAEAGQAEKNEKYISVTRKEFQTAVDQGIMLYVFVDKNVSVEYEVYLKNKRLLDRNPTAITFAHTDNINVFDFISDIRGMGNIFMHDFNGVADIKSFLAKQWADLFRVYLNSMKQDKKIEAINESVLDMKRLIDKMEIMVDGIGKKIMDHETYSQVEVEQDLSEIIHMIPGYLNISFHEISKKEKLLSEAEGFINAIVETFKEDKDNFHETIMGWMETIGLDRFDVSFSYRIFSGELVTLVKNVEEDKLKKRMLEDRSFLEKIVSVEKANKGMG